MKKFQKGDLVRFPSPMGLPDVFPINETKIGILIKKVDKLPERDIIYMIDGSFFAGTMSTLLLNLF